MAAATTLFLLLSLAISFQGSGAAWCVCKPDVGVPALQKALDYACGHGADCAPVLPSGSCHSPDTVAAHCSYAANSYYQRNSQTKDATCDFGGTAALSTTDPSSGSCRYPATPSAAGTSNFTGTGTSSPGSTNPATPGTGGSFTTPIGASGPTASIVPANGGAAAASASAGLHVLLLGVACSILAFLVQ